jgi:hypothetical protein
VPDSFSFRFIVVCIKTVDRAIRRASPFFFPFYRVLSVAHYNNSLLLVTTTFPPRPFSSLLWTIGPHILYYTRSFLLIMLFNRLVFSVLAVGSAVAATQLNERFVDDGFNALTKRQQFIPTTQTAAGDTCADAFGAGYETCKSAPVTSNSFPRLSILITTPY